MVDDSQNLWFSLETQADRARALVNRCRRARTDNYARAADAEVFANLVDQELSPWAPVGVVTASSRYGEMASQTLYRNTARSIYETCVAKVAGLSDERPQLVATNADFTRQQAAADLTRFCEVVYDSPHGDFPNIAALHRHGFALSCVTGTVMVFPEHDNTGRISCHLDDSLTVGFDRSGPNDRPATIVRTRFLLREDLLGRVRGRAARAAVKAAQGEVIDHGLAFNSNRHCITQPVIPVHQGWALNNGATKGRVMWVLGDGTVLLDKEFDSSALPCSVLHFYRPLRGEFGVPLLRLVFDSAIGENRALSTWVDAVENLAHTIAETEDEEVKNQLAAVKTLTCIKRAPGTPPIQWKTPPDNPANHNLANALRDGSFETSGVNQLAASAKGLGGSSGIHEHYRATYQTERMAIQGHNLMQWRGVDSAKCIIREAIAVKEEMPEVSYTWRKGRKERDLVLSSLDLEGADRFALTMVAVDSSRDSAEARVKQAEALMKEGQLSPSEFFSILGNLDVPAFAAEENQVIEWVDEQIEDWLSVAESDIRAQRGELVQVPLPSVGLETLTKLLRKVSLAHSAARAKGASSQRLELFEHFVNSVAAMVQEIRETEARLAGAQGPPQGMPVAPA